MASKSWARLRPVICKVLHKPGHDQRVRFLVTSLDWNNAWAIPETKKFTGRDALPRAVYQNIYCPRGDMENRIKDCQLDLFGKRASCHCYRANQLRLLLAGFAYADDALTPEGLTKDRPQTRGTQHYSPEITQDRGQSGEQCAVCNV